GSGIGILIRQSGSIRARSCSFSIVCAQPHLVEQTDPTGNSLDVTAGANLLVNVASVINTGVIASVTAVMGNYHQVDAISQTFVYSD
ncbi:hypothetical protein ACC677_37410, partial [Rhizobium ruizarguesonis]